MTEQEQRSPQEIQEDIAQTREELGDTAAELADKADVKAQAKAKVDAAKESAQQKKDELFGKAKEAAPDSVGSGAQSMVSTAQQKPLPFAVGAAFLVGIVVGRILRR
jgi:chromosome segregation ATPase